VAKRRQIFGRLKEVFYLCYIFSVNNADLWCKWSAAFSSSSLAQFASRWNVYISRMLFKPGRDTIVEAIYVKNDRRKATKTKCP
jgi:hypothetical protein